MDGLLDSILNRPIAKVIAKGVKSANGKLPLSTTTNLRPQAPYVSAEYHPLFETLRKGPQVKHSLSTTSHSDRSSLLRDKKSESRAKRFPRPVARSLVRTNTLIASRKRPLMEEEKRNIELMRAYNRGEEISPEEVSKIVNAMEEAAGSSDNTNTESRQHSHTNSVPAPYQNGSGISVPRHGQVNPSVHKFRNPSNSSLPTGGLPNGQHRQLKPQAQAAGVCGLSRNLYNDTRQYHQDVVSLESVRPKVVACVVPGISNKFNYTSAAAAKQSKVKSMGGATGVNHIKTLVPKPKSLVVGGVAQPSSLMLNNGKKSDTGKGNTTQRNSYSHTAQLTGNKNIIKGRGILGRGMSKMAQRVGIKGGSDEEDGDDLADFIDDSPTECAHEWVSELRSITGYNPLHYCVSDGEEAVESSFTQQVVEERRSAIIAKEEDAKELELIQAEQHSANTAKKRRHFI